LRRLKAYVLLRGFVNRQEGRERVVEAIISLERGVVGLDEARGLEVRIPMIADTET